MALFDVMGPTTAEVDAARAGDRDSYGRLVEHLWPDLVRLARSVAGDLDAEDVVQDALVHAWSKLDQLEDAGHFKAWVMRIVYRRALRRWRRSRLWSMWDGRDRASPCPDPESEITFWTMLARLPPRQRAVITLTVVDGMSDSEIGASLGITAGSVRAHRRRARARLTQLAVKEWAHE